MRMSCNCDRMWVEPMIQVRLCCSSCLSICIHGSLHADEDDDHDTPSLVQSAQEQRAQDMHMYWIYITGMLTNLGSLSLDRIHSMLSMFVQAPHKYECTKDQLAGFLQGQVGVGLLEVRGGVYSLKK